MSTNNSSSPKLENVTVEDTLSFLNDSNTLKTSFNVEIPLDSDHFMSKTNDTTTWQKSSDRMKKLLTNKKELISNVADEITPPSNRLSFKSLPSNDQSNNIPYSNGDGVGCMKHNNYNYNDMYDQTPTTTITNGKNRSESYISNTSSARSAQNNNSNTSSIKGDNNTMLKKDAYSIGYNLSELFYQDPWYHSYAMKTVANDAYKPSPTTPCSIEDHITMIGNSFSKLSTNPTTISRDDSTVYDSFNVIENKINYHTPLPNVSNKLPHPSFISPPMSTVVPSGRPVTVENKREIEMVTSNKPIIHDIHRWPLPPPTPQNDISHLRPMYEFQRVDNFNTNPSNECIIARNNSKPYVSWIGKLPMKNHPDPIYSNKVFLGGLPWDITEQGLYAVFKQFGPCTFEWPGKDNRSTRHPPKGYVYLIFENERSVKNLLQYCYHDEQRTQFYFRIKTHTANNEKSIQIIPWNLSNSSYLKSSSERLDITKTVFVGGLHGKITAVVFEELFGHVIYAGIDTDKNKYPIGSGRVTFDNFESYRNAIQASFVQINGKNFCKKVQIDPYLEDSICQMCTQQNGPFFCKDFDCLQYFCKECWIMKHCNQEKPHMISHRPINRQNSCDIFEILNSIQYFSQLTTGTANNNNKKPSLLCQSNIVTTQPSSTSNYCPVSTKENSYDVPTVTTNSGCKSSDGNTLL